MESQTGRLKTGNRPIDQPTGCFASLSELDTRCDIGGNVLPGHGRYHIELQRQQESYGECGGADRVHTRTVQDRR